MSGFTFRPAESFTERLGLFVAVVGSTNSGKTFSALRLARGIAGEGGKIAVLDTEGGRTLHLRKDFRFDAHVMDPPFHPDRFAKAAEQAEAAGYDALLVDSFTAEWRGPGGVLDMAEQHIQRAIERDKGFDRPRGEDAVRNAQRQASLIRPKMAHKAMVLSLLQRRMPVIFSIRGEESVVKDETQGSPTFGKMAPVFRMHQNKDFPFELTVSFRLSSKRRGHIDLSDPQSFKMEAAHREIFRDGDLLSEEHGAKLAAWARGESVANDQQLGAFPIIGADGKPRSAPTISAWSEGWHGAIAGRQKNNAIADLRKLRDANREAFDGLRGEHREAVEEIEQLIRTVLGEKEAA
jgi:hypothetical protein